MRWKILWKFYDEMMTRWERKVGFVMTSSMNEPIRLSESFFVSCWQAENTIDISNPFLCLSFHWSWICIHQRRGKQEFSQLMVLLRTAEVSNLLQICLKVTKAKYWIILNLYLKRRIYRIARFFIFAGFFQSQTTLKQARIQSSDNSLHVFPTIISPYKRILWS